ncbi:MAG: sterol desaturase family protein [Polyangiaceae bacterium]
MNVLPLSTDPLALAIGPALIVGAALLFLLLELVRPLRPPTRPKLRRIGVNAVLGGVGGLVMSLAYGPIVLGAVELASRHGLGLLRVTDVGPRWRALAAFVLLDYTLWIWHRVNHRVPLLWRFHAMHHADPDLDTTTALRFHAGELLASVPYRAAQVLVIGVDLAPLLAWELAVLVVAQFHHSNVRLPVKLEDLLRRVIVTPRLHGTHHSVLAAETNVNFGIMLSVWDRLHGTHVWKGEAQPSAIGIREAPGGLTLWQALVLPFTRRKLPVPTTPK